METETTRERLTRYVSEKRSELQRELMSLPEEYSIEAHARSRGILQELQELTQLGINFIQVPRPLDAEEIEMKGMLY